MELAERAEDFIHDMFVMKLLPDNYVLLERFSNEGNFKAWIKKVQINFIADQLRREKVRTKKDPFLIQEPAISPEMETIIKEIMKGVDHCAKQLPPNYRQIYMMRFIEELSVKEIADRLSKTGPQVHLLIYHTRKNLGKCLRGRNINPDIFNDLF